VDIGATETPGVADEAAAATGAPTPDVDLRVETATEVRRLEIDERLSDSLLLYFFSLYREMVHIIINHRFELEFPWK